MSQLECLCLWPAVWKLLALASSLHLTALQNSKSKLFPCCYHLDLAASRFSPIPVALWDTGQASGKGSAKPCSGVLGVTSQGPMAGAFPTPYFQGALRPALVDMQAPVTFTASEGRVGRDLPSYQNASSVFLALKRSSFLVLKEVHESLDRGRGLGRCGLQITYGRKASLLGQAGSAQGSREQRYGQRTLTEKRNKRSSGFSMVFGVKD